MVSLSGRNVMVGREGIEPSTRRSSICRSTPELPSRRSDPWVPRRIVARPPWVEGRCVVPSGEFESPTSGFSSRRSYRLSYDGVWFTLKKTQFPSFSLGLDPVDDTPWRGSRNGRPRNAAGGSLHGSATGLGTSRGPGGRAGSRDEPWNWHELRDSNSRPSVLETDALPAELSPCMMQTHQIGGGGRIRTCGLRIMIPLIYR